MIAAARVVVGELPIKLAKPVSVVYGQGLREGMHAGTDVRRRRIVLHESMAGNRGEFRRILIHELFHLAWVRLSNQTRWSWEQLLVEEQERRARGELGWSAEWRKRALRPEDRAGRTKRWREYACESFCDTAAWRWSGLGDHEEFTLAAVHRQRRKHWLEAICAGGLTV